MRAVVIFLGLLNKPVVHHWPKLMIILPSKKEAFAEWSSII